MFIHCLLFSLTWKFTLSVCASAQGKTCCAGSFWNEDLAKCEKCPLGYFSINCSETCEFPSFGEDCQETCNCKLSLCDHRFGCETDKVDRYDYGTTFSRSTPILENMATTLRTSRSTSFENPIVIPSLSYTILYIVIAFIGIIIILCGLFVGTYFFKHCVRQVVFTERIGKGDIPSTKAGYSSLSVNIQPQCEQPRDPTYLEPVSSHDTHYNEIIENDEINELCIEEKSATKDNQNVELSIVPGNFPHSKSFPSPLKGNENIIGHYKKTAFSTNSL